MKRRWEAAALLAVMLMLGGCAVNAPESKVDEYRSQGEELAAEVVGLIPAELGPSSPEEPQSFGRTLQDPLSSEPAPGDEVWWQVEASVELASGPGASEAAGEAVRAGLVADGWSYEQVRETAEGRVVTDGFRREGWYLEVVWVTDESGLAQTVEITTFSPKTARGDHDEIRS